jgi:hypothetical protein
MKTLYKYRSVANIRNTNHNDYKYFVDIIKKNRLYAAPYKQLQKDDNYEGIYSLNKYTPQYIKDEIFSEKNHLKICSLSRSATNEHLWKRYADNHKGVVIEVEVDSTPAISIQPVKYKDDYRLPQHYTYEANQQVAIDILSHKKKEWQNEKEIRVFSTDAEYIPVKIKRIIVGRDIDIDNENLNCIKNLIKEHNTNICLVDEDLNCIKIQ